MRNALPARGESRSRHEALLGEAPDVGALRVFGCTAWAHVPDTTSRSKLSPRALRGRFLGFEPPLGSGVHRVLLDDGRTVLSRTVHFDEAPPPAATAETPVSAPAPATIWYEAGDLDAVPAAGLHDATGESNVMLNTDQFEVTT